MIKVFIPKSLLKEISLITIEEYWEKGKHYKKETKKIIKGIYLSVSFNTLKNYPQGMITLEDLELKSKEDLEIGSLIVINNKKWKVIQKRDYDYIADIKFYILRRSDKDDSKTY